MSSPEETRGPLATERDAQRTESFRLHERIEADSVFVGRLPVSQVRLHRDARYPWVMLVPERSEIREIHELSPPEQLAFIQESSAVALTMQDMLRADKMNVATLGNMVPQLHVHHVARFEDDDAWPGVIWGAHPALDYTDAALAERLAALREAFSTIPGFVTG